MSEFIRCKTYDTHTWIIGTNVCRVGENHYVLPTNILEQDIRDKGYDFEKHLIRIVPGTPSYYVKVGDTYFCTCDLLSFGYKHNNKYRPLIGYLYKDIPAVEFSLKVLTKGYEHLNVIDLNSMFGFRVSGNIFENPKLLKELKNDKL